MAKTIRSLSTLQNSNLLVVGKFGRSVGVDGTLRLFLQTDFPQSIKRGVKLKSDSPLYPNLEVSYFMFPKDESSHSNSKALVRFVGIDSKDSADQLTNFLLFNTIQATRENCKLDDGEFFWFDIVGCKIFEDNVVLGEVVEIERIGNIDYLHIATDRNLISLSNPNSVIQEELGIRNRKIRKSFLLPYIKAYIVGVSLRQKSILVNGGLALLLES